jgi:hypothetical protein
VHASDVRSGGRRCKHTAAHRAPTQPRLPDGYLDVYREMASFRDGAASGATTIEGVTVGLAIQP